ncbi:hypothetical protein V8B97DRAFT_2022802 [Scleroderma yunnanense]
MASTGHLAKNGPSDPQNTSTADNPRSSMPDNHPSTRSTQVTLLGIINLPGQEVQDAETGWKYLNHIAFSSTYVSQSKGVPPSTCLVVRATAFLLCDITLSTKADQLVSRISIQIKLSVLETISPQVGKVLMAAKQLLKTDESLSVVQQRLSQMLDRPDFLLSLIDDGENTNILQSISKEISTVKKKVLMTIADDSCPNPLIKSLSILKNEGIILEMLDKEMADRMKKDKQQQQLAKATGGDLKFKNRSYTIIVPFLPTHTTLENTDSLKNIEEDNDLSTRSTAEVRWIKPPSCRENTQQVAHAMFYMTDSEAANKLIRDRLYANCHDHDIP